MAHTLSLDRLHRLTEVLRRHLASDASSADLWLDRVVSSVLERVEHAWPGQPWDLEGFFAHLGKVLPMEDLALNRVPTLAYEDLFFAFACSTRDATALALFEREYGPDLNAAIAKLRLSPELAQDARQKLWTRLFVGDGSTPRILEYSGRGALRQWFRVVAVRSLLDELRRAGRAEEQASEEWVLEIPSPTDDPETQYLKQLYGHEFRRAFEEAALELGAEDRNTLRSYYAQRMSIDAMAVAFGIHRATAARRVERARENLVKATRARLAERLALTDHALESVIRMIESNFHLSVQRLLS
jgi:RNA polymerase sigma-70 factor, ECF subfamily